jgi:hypothetical protein
MVRLARREWNRLVGSLLSWTQQVGFPGLTAQAELPPSTREENAFLLLDYGHDLLRCGFFFSTDISFRSPHDGTEIKIVATLGAHLDPK